MNGLVDRYLQACRDFKNIDEYLDDCRETFACCGEENAEKDKADFLKFCKDHQIPMS
jgi:hypothetical protein